MRRPASALHLRAQCERVRLRRAQGIAPRRHSPHGTPCPLASSASATTPRVVGGYPHPAPPRHPQCRGQCRSGNPCICAAVFASCVRYPCGLRPLKPVTPRAAKSAAPCELPVGFSCIAVWAIVGRFARKRGALAALERALERAIPSVEPCGAAQRGLHRLRLDQRPPANPVRAFNQTHDAPRAVRAGADNATGGTIHDYGRQAAAGRLGWRVHV